MTICDILKSQRGYTIVIVATAALALVTLDASAEIYACKGDDGVMSYQDQPCPEQTASAKDAGPQPAAEPESPPRSAKSRAETAPADPELVAACKKRYRDQIDELDAELQQGIEAEEQDAYRNRARALSQQLSRCEYGGADTASGDRRSEPTGRDL